MLPLHFFTIVLNGMPFIRHHLAQMRRLPVEWHWHIVEGVAEHVNDTAWSLPNGAKIPHWAHRDGLSVDGTREYLDEIAADQRVTVYRQPGGKFWPGKTSMCAAPLAKIKTEALLWQIDADELWTTEQFLAARNLFVEHPDKTAAFYWCWYFVGPDCVISTRNCYAQNPHQEWLRTWRFKPGMFWAAHEPPVLLALGDQLMTYDAGRKNPFTHAETEAAGLVFQHYAYATPEQLRFKENYYGYCGAERAWRWLQDAPLPARLGDYLPWVWDDTQVDEAGVYVAERLIGVNDLQQVG